MKSITRLQESACHNGPGTGFRHTAGSPDPYLPPELKPTALEGASTERTAQTRHQPGRPRHEQRQLCVSSCRGQREQGTAAPSPLRAIRTAALRQEHRRHGPGLNENLQLDGILAISLGPGRVLDNKWFFTQVVSLYYSFCLSPAYVLNKMCL